jgi:DNA-binding transcriptional ArsR family regulator
MPRDPLQPKRCAKLLAALAAPERLQILRILRDGPRHVTALSEMLKTSPVNVSHHLGVLRQAGLVRGEKRGRFVLYRLPPDLLQGGEGDPGAAEFLDLGCCRLEVPKPEGEPE